MKSRAEGEEMLKKEFPKTVIVRSASLYGHEDRFLRAIGGKDKRKECNCFKMYFYFIYYAYSSLACSSLPLGYPIVNNGIAKRYALYVGDLAEGLSRIIRLNSNLVEGKTFDLFG